MIDHCIACGADVSDLETLVCQNCMNDAQEKERIYMERCKDIRKEARIAKQKEKKPSTLVSLLYCSFVKWPKEKHVLEQKLVQARMEREDVSLLYENALGKIRELKDWNERLLGFTELSPDEVIFFKNCYDLRRTRK